MTRSRLVDVHAHYVTPRYVDEAIAAGHDMPDGMPWWPTWTVDEQLAFMDSHGIERAVLSASSPGVHFGDDEAAIALAQHVNDFAAEVVRQRPERFDFFGSVPLPDVGAAVIPIYELLNARQAVVLIHPVSPPNWEQVALGRPRPMLEFMFETTRTVTDMVFAGVMERFPDIRFVIPHCGAALSVLTARIELFRSIMPGPHGGPPVQSTTKEQLASCWFDLAGFAFSYHAPAITNVVGEDHIVYGSDSCWTPAPSVEQLMTAIDDAAPPATAEDWWALTRQNAEALLDRVST